MSNIITIDYNGKQLLVDLDTMKVVDKEPVPTDFKSADYFLGLIHSTWMEHNLDYDDGEGGIARNPDHPEYGCYYTWEAAMRVAEKIPGWQLPSVSDFDVLNLICGGSNVAGLHLKSLDWNGDDKASFGALPSGSAHRNGDKIIWHNVGDFAGFWSSDELGKHAFRLRLGNKVFSVMEYSHKTSMYPIRLVRNTCKQ